MAHMEQAALRAAIYVRVSTFKKAAQANQETGERSWEQNPEIQKEELLRYVSGRGMLDPVVYVDRASGTRDSRPALDEMMKDARRRKFSMVVVWRFDRFARSVRQLVLALEEFRSLGIEFVSLRESIDTSTPMGKVMFTIIAAMAEFERDIMRERIAAGMEHAAKHGTKSGRPIGRPRRVFDRDRAWRMRSEGASWPKIAAALGVSRSTLRRVLGAPPDQKGAGGGVR